jgi:NAD(P)-dependent dehydrogenase (short-subunit alcohol dehydrogenase family)
VGQAQHHVNAVCPGYFPTKLSAGLAERADEIAKVTPLGRAGGDYDIKGSVVFFVSEARATSAVRRLRSTVPVPPQF